MKVQQIIENKFKPAVINIHLGGFTGTKIPDDLKKFIAIHIKQSKNGSYYINEYPDSWYSRTFQGDGPSDGIYDFKTFMDVLKPYFRVQKIIQR